MGRIGYIRVSTEHQETARQESIMQQYQVERVFAEKMSGKNANRPELKAMLEYVRDGDTMYIESISRLGRSTRVLLNIIDVLQRKGVTLVSSKENIDTNTLQITPSNCSAFLQIPDHRDLLSRCLAVIVLLAECAVLRICTRQQTVCKGRKRHKTDLQFLQKKHLHQPLHGRGQRHIQAPVRAGKGQGLFRYHHQCRSPVPEGRL